VKALVRLAREQPRTRKLVLGLDKEQVRMLDEGLLSTAGRRVQVGHIMGRGRGYFKMVRGPPGAVVNASGVEGLHHSSPIICGTRELATQATHHLPSACPFSACAMLWKAGEVSQRAQHAAAPDCFSD
jgi:hypothetical protein